MTCRSPPRSDTSRLWARVWPGNHESASITSGRCWPGARWHSSRLKRCRRSRSLLQETGSGEPKAPQPLMGPPSPSGITLNRRTPVQYAETPAISWLKPSRICGYAENTDEIELGRARSINAVPVNVRHLIFVECSTPDLVTAREDDSETRTPRFQGTAPLSNLYRALESPRGIVDLPNIDTVLAHLSKQPDRPVRSSHHLPDGGVVFRNPERPENGTAPTLEYYFTRRKNRVRGCVVSGPPSCCFLGKAALHRRCDFAGFVFNRSLHKRVSTDRDRQNVKGRWSSAFIHSSNLYNRRAVRPECRQVCE